METKEQTKDSKTLVNDADEMIPIQDVDLPWTNGELKKLQLMDTFL